MSYLEVQRSNGRYKKIGLSRRDRINQSLIGKDRGKHTGIEQAVKTTLNKNPRGRVAGYLRFFSDNQSNKLG